MRLVGQRPHAGGRAIGTSTFPQSSEPANLNSGRLHDADRQSLLPAAGRRPVACARHQPGGDSPAAGDHGHRQDQEDGRRSHRARGARRRQRARQARRSHRGLVRPGQGRATSGTSARTPPRSTTASGTRAVPSRPGVNGADAGIAMLAHPTVGQTYREEYYVGHAEDRSQVLGARQQAEVPFGPLQERDPDRGLQPGRAERARVQDVRAGHRAGAGADGAPAAPSAKSWSASRSRAR